jgi:ferredoxin
MGKKVFIDEDEEPCRGCGLCVAACPDIFGLDKETEKDVVLNPEGGDECCIEEAIDSCPVECIDWEED